MTTEEIIAELERLYAMLPSIECKGLCWNSCGPIDMSHTERQRIEARGIQIEPFSHERARRWDNDEPLHCAALTEDKQCAVYDVRPLVCRMWGVTESMPCTYGCKPDPGYVMDEDAMRALAYSLEVGGGMPEGANAEIAAVMSDPEIAPLMKRFISGDTSVEHQLAALIARKRGQA